MGLLRGLRGFLIGTINIFHRAWCLGLHVPFGYYHSPDQVKYTMKVCKIFVLYYEHFPNIILHTGQKRSQTATKTAVVAPMKIAEEIIWLQQESILKVIPNYTYHLGT